jgi:DNA-directed RNA polymerase specialized sigma24 family protein
MVAKGEKLRVRPRANESKGRQKANSRSQLTEQDTHQEHAAGIASIQSTPSDRRMVLSAAYLEGGTYRKRGKELHLPTTPLQPRWIKDHARGH